MRAHKRHQESPPPAFRWFLIQVFCLIGWGACAGLVAYRFQIPLDFLGLFTDANHQQQAIIAGISYCLALGLGIAILGSIGLYSSLMGFVVLLACIIALIDFISGRVVVTDMRNDLWLLVLPVILIRDLVTLKILQDHCRAQRERQEPVYDGSQSHNDLFR